MILEDLLRRLSRGPLSNLAIGGSGTGAIPEGKIPQIVSYVNEGLRALYTRFPIKESRLVLRLSLGVTRYRLVKTNASTVEPTGFILDTQEKPFEGDVIKIIAANNSAGQELPLNSIDDPLSIFTPEPDTIVIPNSYDGGVLFLAYQALPDEIYENEIEQPIPISRLLEDALIAYVAHCVYRDINSETAVLSSQQHLSRYENICARNVEADLVSTQAHGMATKFYDRGFI